MSFHVGCDPDVISVKSLTLKDTRDESKLVQKYDWFPSDANPDLVRWSLLIEVRTSAHFQDAYTVRLCANRSSST